jgi:glycosyltransferase involved in cell wall biosynthesis
MKIAYVYDAVYPWIKGGAEKRIYELSRRLVQRGHEVHWYGIKWWSGEEVLLKDGLHLHGVCPPMDLYFKGRRSYKEALYFAWRTLRSLRGKYDLIDCQEFPYLPCFSSKLWSIASGAELFITWHEVWGDYWYEYLGPLGSFGVAVEKAVAALGAKNIAVSESTRRGLRSMGIEEVGVVPNGIDLREIQGVKAEDEGSDFIFAGRLIRDKNVDLLIRSLGLVKEEVPDLRCIIIGDGPERGMLENLVHALGLDENVRFLGFLEKHEDVVAQMKASRLFVLPSTREGFGIVVLEANASGLPVVTINHKRNASADLITEGTGFLCEPTCESLASSLLRGLEEGASMRQSCLELAKSYDWGEICLSLEEHYQQKDP